MTILSNKAALKTLQDNCWSIVCKNEDTGGDDYSIAWLVVAQYMAEPKQRVIGYASETEGPKAAIEAATKLGNSRFPDDFLYEYKPEVAKQIF